jgi:hypothetical protein
LTKALKRLSVSPKKPTAKKRKLLVAGNTKFAIAPIFRPPTLGPKALEYQAKPENERQVICYPLTYPSFADTMFCKAF